MIFYLRSFAFLLLLIILISFFFKKFSRYRYLFLFLITALSHGLAVMVNAGIPLVLLFGPLILLALRDYRRKPMRRIKALLHCLPFLLFSLWYFVLYWLTFRGVYSEEILEGYYIAYFLAMPVSLISYGIMCLMRSAGKQSTFEAMADQLCFLEIIAGLLILCFFVNFATGLPHFSFNIQWIVLALQGTSVMLVIRFLVYSYRRTQQRKPEKKKWEEPQLVPLDERIRSYKGTMPPLDMLASYEEKLKEYFITSKAFLNPGLTAGMVADELGISKYHFSVLLNVYVGRNFYNFLAYHRIAYAIELIEKSESSFSMEALASECGFNSKTSFNRYFREFTGLTPSEFKGYLGSPGVEVPA